jgi:hypothetical protein
MHRLIFCIAILFYLSPPSFAEVSCVSLPADDAKWAERAISQKSRQWLKDLDKRLQSPIYKTDLVTVTTKIAKKNETHASTEDVIIAETYTPPGKDIAINAVNVLPAIVGDPSVDSSKDINTAKAEDGWAERAITKKSRKWLEKVNEEFSLHMSGSASNEFAYRISSPDRVTKIKNQLILSETGQLCDNLRFKVSGRGYYDPVYYTTTYEKNVRSDQMTDIEFRDTYLDYSVGPVDLRLGNQEIVWGEALALFFADVVNARDLREFILPDFDMIRVPQWGMDLEFSQSNFHGEFVWLPFLQFDKLGVSGSEFYSPPPIPTVTTPFYAYDPPDVPSTFANSNVGGRLSYLFNNGLDVSTFYYHTWTHSPVYFRTILNNGLYLYYPEYRRLDMIGATFAKEVNGMVFKGEFVFNKDDYLPVFDVTDSDGIVRRNNLNYLLGLDYTFHGGIETNLQFMQRVVFNYTDTLINEKEVTNSLAFRIAKSFMDGKLEPELLMVTNLGRLDMMLRPKCVYKVTGDWRLRFGLDIFLGNNPMGFFGRYDKKSRIYLETAYHF